MCGIVGAVAREDIVPVLVEGLRRLEYRGYDSCGVAVLSDGSPRRARSIARVSDLRDQVREARLEGCTGIAHTRWATHGAPVTDNAHPIFSCNAIAVVHNGIIENYEELREMLRAKGYDFVSQTDTEVIAHLLHSMYNGDLFECVCSAVKQLNGAYAIAVMHKEQPHIVVGARQGSPLVVGVGDGKNFLASDTLALAGSTERFVYLEEGDVVELAPNEITIADREGGIVERTVRVVAAYGGVAELGPYRHFMQKEIFEQPRAITDTVPQADALTPDVFGAIAGEVFPGIDSLLILACGTSYHSGLTSKYWFESIAKIPTQVEIASEYRYRDSVANPRALVVVISQSGETADTLAALRHAQSLGHRHTLAICNMATSAMVRQTESAFLTRAGVEVGVASTKAFTTQLVALFLLAATLGRMRGHVDAEQESAYLAQLRHLPAALNSVLALEPQIIAWSEVIMRKDNALFLGRGLHYPIALEGALKLKEISYIHAEAYPAGELKHGPLALVTEAMPVVTVAPNDALLNKLKSNMQEVRARGGELFVFADVDTHIRSEGGIHVIRMPEHYGALSPILHVVPLQLLAYHTACARGTDVDKPRNLAKSVTVE
ncbi:glutamine--fructose-6-phosphate transaminase (isomerizing) [Paraburkholderia hospita]|jgi:glucosamine--fructose-6-phosphate aminotransferase (isomerizing)|uniref:Glutamine--fructose-6-phosphate aminotransferase [isomerizing] n=1 Tax=Paraburkholderia hospita TaxID=169430 RepID=A0AAN1MJK5_9BURK|nr:glutamine--fructose-6-phosphate transaminase (isomerizing) [Paraburkholderia hospita]AUT69400.1 glutamine--fructose-6-phosphate transaminase (isomerizing) [Paraburkholderia hospita]SEI22311.1 glutamine--fructose-6-phosphate transaminase [Paraburkholderia hospita]